MSLGLAFTGSSEPRFLNRGSLTICILVWLLNTFISI